MRKNGRKLQIENRYLRNSIDTMVQGDPVRALIELVTNSDDSYARLEARGQSVSGRIFVDVVERRGDEPSLLRVTDEAEGFTAEDLELKLGRMGKSTSGLEEGLEVRGFFGGGLKEAILGLKLGGSVSAIREGMFVSAELYWEGSDKEATFYPPTKPRPATRAQRRQLQLARNGTRVEIEVKPELRIPQHATLRNDLMFHVSLRDIVQNPDRQLVLRRLAASGKVLHADEVTYQDPLPDPEFKPVLYEGTVPGYPKAKFSLKLLRAREELSGGEIGMKRIGGLVVQSKRALVDITLFGHENRPGTERLYGRLCCDSLYDLLLAGEMVVTNHRSGLVRENPFVRKLAAEVDNVLAPIVEAEANRLRQGNTPEDPQTRKRLDDVCRELNKIAREELELTGPGDETAPSQFRFEYGRYRLFRGDKRVVRLLVSRELLDGPTLVELSLSGEGLSAHPARFHLDPAEAFEGTVSGEVSIEASTLLDDGRISARFGEYAADATVAVIERLPPPDPFAFERESYRATVGQWYPLGLKLQVSRVLLGTAEVVFSLENGNIKLKDDVIEVNPSQARQDWLVVNAEVFGDQVGMLDTVVATMGGHSARAQVVIIAQRKSPEHEERGGLIKRIEFNDTVEKPFQRTIFADGVITVFVNEPSIRRYLKRTEDRGTPAGRAIQGELVLQAFCRYLAVRKTEKELMVITGELGSSVDAVMQRQNALIKQYGERIHSLINPR